MYRTLPYLGLFVAAVLLQQSDQVEQHTRLN